MYYGISTGETGDYGIGDIVSGVLEERIGSACPLLYMLTLLRR